MMTAKEFDELLKNEGIEEAKRQLMELINKLPEPAIKELYLFMKEQEKMVATIKKMNEKEAVSENLLDEIKQWIFTVKNRIGENHSAKEMLHTICREEGIVLNKDFEKKLEEKLMEGATTD